MISIGARYPGFNVIKLRAKGGMPVAFADFEVLDTWELNAGNLMFYMLIQQAFIHISSIVLC